MAGLTASGSKKIVLKENKERSNASAPKFIISYDQGIPSKEARAVSFEILSDLVGDSDIIVELNSSYLTCSPGLREKYALDFFKGVKSLELDFRYRKTVSGKKSFLSLFSFGGSKDLHEIFAYVPNHVWKQDAFRSILSTDGVRYYVTKEPMDSEKILENFYKGHILEDEKPEIFSLVVFDCVAFGQMGIISDSVSLEDIRSRLGL